MSLRLSDLVVCGELCNTRKNCVHGYLRLRGFERPLALELTGNCAADLAGRQELELMDELIERGVGEPVGALFDGPLRLRRPDQLNDREAEQELKALLAQLALHGIALDICVHFTAAEAYRLLVERICREENAYAELRGTQWVQHFSTADFCPACQAEFERD